LALLRLICKSLFIAIIHIYQITKAKDSLLGDCEANMRGRDAELKATRMYLRRFVE